MKGLQCITPCGRNGGSLERYEVEKELAREEETIGYAERGAVRSRKITPGVSREGVQFIFLINICVQNIAASAIHMSWFQL